MLVERVLERLQPRFDERSARGALWLETIGQQVRGLDIDHAAARDGRGRGDGEVLDLEHDAVRLGERDDLARVEAELLIVVEHCVHVLDPDGVDGAVEHHPLDVFLRDASLVGIGLRNVADEHRANAVRPLAGGQVEGAVQLVHRDRLWVELVHAHLLIAGDPLALVVLAARHGRLQHAQHLGFATARRADSHHAVAHGRHLVELDALDSEVDGHLQPHLLGHARELGLELGVDGVRLDDAREEILDDRAEEQDVVTQELGQVRVTHGAEHLQVLLHLGVILLQVARGLDDGVDGAHAEVVVVLRGELLGREPEGAHELLCERLRLVEAEGEEANLRNQRVIGHHHRHRPVERLEVVGQLTAARVARVHRNEVGSGRVELHVGALEIEPLLLLDASVHDRKHLLRNDREHLDVDPVELVEARPRTRRAEPLEELAHRLVVEAVRAVEDDALLGERLGEVLDGLRLAGARGACGRAAKLDVHRTHECHVAPIGERRDHQTRRGTEVLVAIRVVALDHAHDHILLAQVAPAAPVLHSGRVGRVLPVVAQLRDPLEVADRGAFAFNEPLDHVTCVHLDDDERRHDLVLQLVELGAHEEGELLELAEHLLVIILHPLRARTVHVLLDAQSPVEGRDGDGGLRRVREHEGAALLHLVLAQSILDELAHREAHHLLDDAHPNLHRALRVDSRHEGHHLLLGRDHVGHRTVLALHRDSEDRLEALAKVGLHRIRVLGLREDGDEFVVRKEVEAREGRTLRLEVVGEILLDALELVVRLDPLLEQLVVVAKGNDLGRLAHTVERLPPEPVHI